MKNLKPKNEFGKWLLSICKTSKITVEDLSNLIGVDKQRVYEWITKGRQPTTLNIIFTNTAVAKLTGKTEGEVYRLTSSAILKDS